jgi:hypothetical protein
VTLFASVSVVIIFQVAMVVIATCAGRFHTACDEGFHRHDGIVFFSCDHQHSACSQVLDKACSGTAGDQHIHAVEGVCGAMIEAMDGHVGIKIEPLNFAGQILSVSFEDNEATRTSGVASDGAVILAGNCYTHEILLTVSWEEATSVDAAGKYCLREECTRTVSGSKGYAASMRSAMQGVCHVCQKKSNGLTSLLFSDQLAAKCPMRAMEISRIFLPWWRKYLPLWQNELLPKSL